MPTINIAEREIICKLVYYGPGLGGKTTNIQYLHKTAHPKFRGELVSIATETDRTLFFDFLPMAVKKIGGFTLRFHLFTVPGQVIYEESRKIVLKGADGVVFVADSQADRRLANEESLEDMTRNLALYRLDIRTIPRVMQYNKRDVENPIPLDDMRYMLNYLKVPEFEAVAVRGEGVIETFKEISRLVLTRIQEKIRGVGGE